MAISGFKSWKPTGESRAILHDALQVFDMYKEHLPLTGRQVFYVMAGQLGWPKNDAFANRLYSVLGRARRAGWLPFTHLRDGGGQNWVPLTYADENAFWTHVENEAKHYVRKRQTGQEQFIELFCEAPGMMPQLQRVAGRYSIPVYGTRGYTGLSVVSEVARRALMRDVPTTILQIGDLDPSGVGIFETLRDDVEAFVNQAVGGLLGAAKKDDTHQERMINFVCNLGVTADRCWEILRGDEDTTPAIAAERIILTWDQVEEHGLETAPPNPRDSRSKNWPYPDSAQAEAMPPDILAQTVTDEIESRLDMDRYHEEVDKEQADEDAIWERLER